MTIQPDASPFDRFSSTQATTPSPSRIKINVPIKNVRLELHQEFVLNHAAVGTQRLQLLAGIKFHGFEYFAGLVSCGFKDRACQMTFIRVTCETDDHASSVRSPVRGEKPGE